MKIDPHCHTIYSKHWFWGYDALSTPEEMIKAAIKKGLTGLAITDHNSVQGGLMGKKIAKRYKFTVIPGSEITTEKGHLLALGITKNITPYLSVEETVEKIHNEGGIAIAPHPFSMFRGSIGMEAMKADAIEIFNAKNTTAANAKALWIAKNFKKPQTAGSDSHWDRNVGYAGIICEDPIEDILKGKIQIFGDYILKKDIIKFIFIKFKRSFKWRLLKYRPKNV